MPETPLLRVPERDSESLPFQLLQRDKRPYPMSTVAAVVLDVESASGVPLITGGLCFVVDAAQGLVDYPPEPPDVLQPPGMYVASLRATLTNGRTRTFGPLRLEIFRTARPDPTP